MDNKDDENNKKKKQKTYIIITIIILALAVVNIVIFNVFNTYDIETMNLFFIIQVVVMGIGSFVPVFVVIILIASLAKHSTTDKKGDETEDQNTQRIPNMIRCKYCRSLVEDDEKTCKYCGAKLDKK